MKRYLLICLFALSTLFALAGCGNNEREVEKDMVKHEGFYVEGTKLYDANGNEFVMRGINMAHCWYKDYDSVSFDAIQETGANCVRIVCACGERWDADSAEDMKKLIEEATQRDMVAILEFHDATGSNSNASLIKIAQYWCKMADILKGTEDRVIVNIANEWSGVSLPSNWKKGYVEAVPMLREAGIKNCLMIDAGGWGQNGNTIKKYGNEILDKDIERNIVFAIHMYGTAGKNEKTIRKNLEGVIDKNLCVCVGEFGQTHTDGDVDEDFIMKYCTENSIGYLPWSWKGNSGGVEYLDLAVEWDGSILSEDWGEKAINGEYGIRNTSKKCTVFE